MNTMCYRCMRNTGVDGVCSICGGIIRTQRDIGDDYLLPLGTLLDEGNILIGEKLGRGGFGITYVALDTSEFGLIALKEFVPSHMIHSMRVNNAVYIDPEDTEQYKKHMAFFQAEARTLAKLNHPNIVKVYFEFEENNTCYYGMELLKGLTLHQWVRNRGAVPAQEAFKIIDPVLDALKYIHSQNVYHRDISPGNIFLRDAPGKYMDVDPCLIDFGAAYDAQVAYSKSAPHIKSRGFSPPEQNAGRSFYGPYSDVYAISAVLYYMVTGRTPDPSEDRSLYGATLAEPCAVKKDVPKAFSDAIMRGMHLDRNQRTQSIGILRRELFEALGTRPRPEPKPRVPKAITGNKAEAEPPPPIPTPERPQQPERPRRDTRRLRSFLGSVLDAAMFGGAWALVMNTRSTWDMVEGNLWVGGLGVLLVSLLCNILLCLVAGGSLGECMTGSARGKLPGDQAVYCALSQTAYPYALLKKLMALSAEAPPEACAPPEMPDDSPATPRPGYAQKGSRRVQGPCLEAANPGDGRVRVREAALKPEGQVLGRWQRDKKDCDIEVSDSMCVSRKHCKIAFNGRWYIEDVGSKNGTFVNGSRLANGKRVPLTDGCRLSLGDDGIDLIFHEK